MADTYQIYDPENYSERSARWAIDFVDNLANLQFQDVAADVRTVRDPFEAEIFAEQAKVEAEALALYKRIPRSSEVPDRVFRRKNEPGDGDVPGTPGPDHHQIHQ